MINLAVINIKDLIKLMLKIAICITILFIIIKFIKMIKFNKLKDFASNYSFSQCLNTEIAILNYNKKDEKINFSEDKILSSQFSLFGYEKNNKNNIEAYEESSESNIDGIVASEDSNEYKQVETQVIEENNIPVKMTDSYNNVAIKNESDYTLTEDILTPEISVENTKDILIFHTHTCESYTPTEQNNYESSGNYRTTDLNYSVVRVGDELENRLKEKRL